MLSKLALAATIGLATARPAPQESQSLQANQHQIVGGVEAEAGEIPYIVSLQRVGGAHFCGGVLLSSNVVLTAAHCSTSSASQVSVRAGSTTWNSGGETSAVSSITVHPEYSPGTEDNDIAIWHLSGSIGESSLISYISLPTQGSDPSAGTTSTVSGWGYLEEFVGAIPTNLMTVDVPVISRSECADLYRAQGLSVTSNMVCAGYEAGGQDACSGDSGGPLVDGSGTLIGLVSWGVGCARGESPGVYARVGNYIEWIADNI